MRLYDYSASGNCFKVRLLLGMLATEYERVPVDIFAGATLTDEYFAINPLRETPVLELEGGERIAQSGAILWYLAEGAPRGNPARSSGTWRRGRRSCRAIACCARRSCRGCSSSRSG